MLHPGSEAYYRKDIKDKALKKTSSVTSQNEKAKPTLLFYDVEGQEDFDKIEGGLIFLELDRRTKEVKYLTNKEWLTEDQKD